MLVVLVVDVFLDGLPYLDLTLLTNPPSSDPDIAGARPAILATLYIGLLLLLFVVPIGVGTALYLEEYADKTRWYNRLLEINIQNLAAVPSIVYGILGLAFLVRGLGLGRVLLAGAMILTLLVLPTVIIAAREAIRSVPDSIRQGAYALGATQWQVVSRQVLPAAIPGIATGSILALSRAIGETAPLIMIGAVTYISFDPTILGPFTALPIQIYSFLRLPQEEFKLLAAACDHRPARAAPDAERIRDLPPQPLQENLVTTMTEQASTIEPMSLAEIAKEHGDQGVTNREAVFKVSDLSVSYSGNVAIRDVGLERLQERGDRVHRPERMRQEHADPLLRPDERPRAGREGRGRGALPRQGPLRAPTSTRSRCAAGSGWSSRSRTRSRSRSTTTSPSGRACSASRGTSTSASSGRCTSRRSGTRSRTG